MCLWKGSISCVITVVWKPQRNKGSHSKHWPLDSMLWQSPAACSCWGSDLERSDSLSKHTGLSRHVPAGPESITELKLCLLFSSQEDRFAFLTEWYDPSAALLRRYQLLYYPKDGSVEMVRTPFLFQVAFFSRTHPCLATTLHQLFFMLHNYFILCIVHQQVMRVTPHSFEFSLSQIL